MKTTLAMTLVAAVATLSAIPSAASAQIVYQPQYLTLIVNQISNPGFETSPITPWDSTGAYVHNHGDGTTTYTGLGHSTTSYHHAGTRAFDFGIGMGTYSNDFYSPLRQTLSTPLAGNQVYSASVWVYSEGQYLDLKIKYTDNTSNTVSFYTDGETHPQQTAGWRQWSFASAINPNKTVASLEFSVSAGMFYTHNVVIDDVSVTKLVKIFL